MSLGIVYNPLYDLHNCIFRCLCLLTSFEQKSYNIEAIKVADFYFILPSLIEKIRLTLEIRQVFKSTLQDQITKPYTELPEANILFDRLSKIQENAFRYLVGMNIICEDEFKVGKIYIKGNIPDSLEDKITDNIKNNISLINFLKKLVEMPVAGANGLKDRTGLLEHKYDVV